MAVKKIGTLNKHQNPATNENEFDIENYMNVNWDKIKEVVDNNADELTTTQGKVTALETDNTNNKSDIQELQTDVSDIKSEQQVQNDLLERTQSALINITTPKSNNINVKDSSDLNAKIDVFGISEQETREGYNLFNNTKTISNVTYNSEEDKWIFNLPNRYDHIAQKGTFFKNIKANTNYTLYFNILKNTSSAAILFNLTNTIWNNNIQISAGQTGVVVNNIKTREDLSTALYDLWFSHLNTITGEFEAQIMLLEGTYTSQNIPNYEQYGASPTPEYPSEIENVTGDIDIKIYNKNLLDLTKCGFSNCVKNEDGSVRSNINNGYYATITTSQLNDFILQNKGRSLTFSFEGISTKTIGFYIPCKRANSDSDYFETTKTGNSITMQIPEDLESLSYIQIRWNRQSTPFTDTTTVINNIQLELNDVKTDFVEYEEQATTFSLAEGQRLADGDYLASDGIHHKRTQVEIKGIETQWIYYSANDVWARPYLTFTNKKIGESNNTANALCNKAKSISWEDMAAGLDEYAVFTYEGDRRISISVKKEDLETQDIAGVKKYFQENNMIVEYNLEEEEIEPYTPEQQEAYNKLQNAQSYYNVTNVVTDKALLEFKYIADTQTWVINEIKPLKEQISTINQLLSTTNTSALLLNNLQTDLESEVV